MKEQENKAQSTIDSQPDKITPRHRALMRRLVAGMTLSDACVDIGFSISRASVIVTSPLFKAEMEKMQTQVDSDFSQAEAERAGDGTRKILSESSEQAAKTLKGALNDENTTARVSAAKDILDRTGYAKEDKIKANVLVEPSQAFIDVVSRIVKEKDAKPNESDTS